MEHRVAPPGWMPVATAWDAMARLLHGAARRFGVGEERHGDRVRFRLTRPAD